MTLINDSHYVYTYYNVTVITHAGVLESTCNLHVYTRIVDSPDLIIVTSIAIQCRVLPKLYREVLHHSGHAPVFYFDVEFLIDKSTILLWSFNHHLTDGSGLGRTYQLCWENKAATHLYKSECENKNRQQQFQCMLHGLNDKYGIKITSELLGTTYHIRNSS